MVSKQTFSSFDIPFSVIATWPHPHYQDPVTRRWLVPYVIILQILVTVVVCIRIWVRQKQQRGAFPIEDVMIVAASVIAGGFTGLSCWGVLKAGFDRHIWDVSPTAPPYGGIAAMGCIILFLCSIGLTKISNLIFQRRLITRTDSRKLKLMIDFGMVFVAIYSIVFTLFSLFQCSPVESVWESVNILYTKPYKCLNRTVMDPASGIMSVITDIYALLLPNLLVHSLQIGLWQKLMVCGLLSCNILTVGAGIARTYYFWQLHRGLHDLSWTAYNILVWSSLEMQMAIVCASAPQLKVFLETTVSKRFTICGLVQRTKRYLLSKDSVTVAATVSASSDKHNKLDKPVKYHTPYSNVELSENFSGARTLVSGTYGLTSVDMEWGKPKAQDGGKFYSKYADIEQQGATHRSTAGSWPIRGGWSSEKPLPNEPLEAVDDIVPAPPRSYTPLNSEYPPTADRSRMDDNEGIEVRIPILRERSPQLSPRGRRPVAMNMDSNAWEHASRTMQVNNAATSMRLEAQPSGSGRISGSGPQPHHSMAISSYGGPENALAQDMSWLCITRQSSLEDSQSAFEQAGTDHDRR